MTTLVLFRLGFALALAAALWLRVQAARARPFQYEADGGLEAAVATLLALLADGVGLVLGAAYLLGEGVFSFADQLHYPMWVRWIGAGVALAGVALLAWALGPLRQAEAMDAGSPAVGVPQRGPYRWIRHPVYAGTLLSYLGAGMLSSNWVLTFVPAVLHLGAMVRQVPREEALLQESLDPQEISYMQRTGMFFPSMSELRSGGTRTDEGTGADLAETDANGGQASGPR